MKMNKNLKKKVKEMDSRGKDLIVLSIQQKEIIENALKLTYRHVHMTDENVSSGEVSEAVFNALCELLGDKEFVKWTFELEEK